MKYARILIPAYLLLSLSSLAQTGSTCGNAFPLTFDGVIRNYSTSSSTGGYLLCTGTGNSPITWFQLTTDASAQCPLLTISTSDNQACEVAMYSSCAGSIIAGSSMCFYDGTGLWAPAQNFALSANTTYYLRVKTSTTCTLSIGAQFYTPANNNCAGAFSIGTNFTTDNNSCHKPATGITASQLCAFSIENTAFYQFYVATTGVCIININSISCDNGASNNSNGFQIGFFTGSCASLSWLSCTSGSGSFVQATTPSLTAGTKVYVAIDGNAGSNCAYGISGINILSVLDEGIRNFSGWQEGSVNKLRWSRTNEVEGYYEIEKSTDGFDFYTIGKLPSMTNKAGTANYSFVDRMPAEKTFYRLKQTNLAGKIASTYIIKLERKPVSDIQLTITSPVLNTLYINLMTNRNEQLNYSILNTQGAVVLNHTLSCVKGSNHFAQDISTLPPGIYFFSLKNKNGNCNATFVKAN